MSCCCPKTNLSAAVRGVRHYCCCNRSSFWISKLARGVSRGSTYIPRMYIYSYCTTHDRFDSTWFAHSSEPDWTRTWCEFSRGKLYDTRSMRFYMIRLLFLCLNLYMMPHPNHTHTYVYTVYTWYIYIHTEHYIYLLVDDPQLVPQAASEPQQLFAMLQA